MRKFLFLLIVASVGAVWWWVGRDQVAERTQMSEKVALASAEIGVRRMLMQSEYFRFSDVVVGPKLDDGGWDFRGLLVRDGSFRPAYGRAGLNCESGFEAPQCWHISYLEADGKEVALQLEGQAPEVTGEIPDPAADSPLPADDPLTTVTTVQESPMPGEIPVSDEIPAPGADVESGAEATVVGNPGGETSVAAEPATDPQVAADPVVVPDLPTTSEIPQATHRVARARINTRSGPGTGNPIVTTLSGGTLLALIESDGSWGRFLILEGAASGTEVWSALSIVESIGP